MKRYRPILVVLAVLLMAASAFGQAEPYSWTLSASSTDPFVNTTAFTPGLGTIYLWLACCALPDPLADGMSAAEFAIFSTDPTTSILSLTTENGFLNAGTPTEPLLAVGGCPCGPVLAASLLVLNQGETQFCFRASAANSIKATVDCESVPSLWSMAWIGLATGSQEICSKSEACAEPPTSVEGSSFGHIKGLYR